MWVKVSLSIVLTALLLLVFYASYNAVNPYLLIVKGEKLEDGEGCLFKEKKKMARTRISIAIQLQRWTFSFIRSPCAASVNSRKPRAFFFVSVDLWHSELMVHPPWLRMMDLMSRMESFRLLDIGTGSGRTPLELQSRFTESFFQGTNSLEYESGNAKVTQALNDADLIAVARRFGIPIACNCQNRPLLPRLTFVNVNDRLFGKVFARGSFDFITSVMALNGPSKTVNHEYFPLIVALLSNSTLAAASLHVGDAAFDGPVSNRLGPFATVKSFVATEGHRKIAMSLTLKLAHFRVGGGQDGQPFYFVSCTMRVCPAPVTRGDNCLRQLGIPVAEAGWGLLKQNVHIWEVTRASLNNFVHHLRKFEV